MEKGRKYLRIELEKKGIMLDLDYIKSEDIKLQLGYVNQKVFNQEKIITLKDLENGGFNL